MQLMPDSPVRRAALEVEHHVGTDGWDQPARLFALVPTDELVKSEPELAQNLSLGTGGFTSIEQDVPADGRSIEDLLSEISWPESVTGCVVVMERVMLPPDAEDSLPDDPTELIAAAASHPDRREVRLVAAVTRGGAVHSAVRGRDLDSEGNAAELLEGPDLVPGLVELVRQTLEP